MYYGPDIMKKAGIRIPNLNENESALILNIPLSLFNAVGALVAIFVIDRLGRRFIILRTTPFMAASWFVTAAGMAFVGNTSTT